MILVFILLAIVIILFLLLTIILLSTIKIEIKNLQLGNKKIVEKNKYEVKISLYFLSKIPIFWVNLNKNKIRKIYDSKKLEKIDFKMLKNELKLNKQTLKMIKAFKIRIKKLELKVGLGTENAIITSYLVALIASSIGIILPHVTEKNEIQNCNYIVKPIYQDKNEYYIYLNSIICIKVVHIIYSLLNFTKKGRKEYERTSNRRTYAYRNE